MAAINLELLRRSGNEAIELNPTADVDFHITDHGSDWLWAAFCLFGVASLVYLVLTYSRELQKRAFYYNSLALSAILFFTYFTMASDLGWTDIQAEFNHVTVDKSITDEHPGVRQIFYARYVGWFLSWPFIITNLSLLAKLDWPHIVLNIISTEIYVLGLLIGSLIRSTYKWGYFSFAVASYFLTVFNLFSFTRQSAAAEGNDVRKTFTINTALVAFLWFIYPICFGLSEGGNVIQPDSEAVFYGVLDVCLFVIYPAIFLFTTSKISYSSKPENNVNSFPEDEGRASGETAVGDHETPDPSKVAAEHV